MSQQSKSDLLATITVLIKLIEMKDPYTEGHSEKVSMWSEIVARNLGLNKKEQEEIKLAARLHDIGKISIPDRILNKPGRLNKEEYAEVKKHPGLGADILSNIDRLKEVSRIIRHHHEWYNGEGYPDGLVGEKIPLGSRIINVVDAYQAMISNRPYRKAFPKEKAIAELKRGAGTQFDPEIVRVFIEILNEKRGKDQLPEGLEVRQKQTKEVSVKECNLLQTLMDSIPDCIYFKDDKNRFVRVNRARAKLSKTTPENMIGKTDFDFFSEEEAKKAFEDDRQIMQSGKPIIGKLERITDAEGKEHWFSVIKVPWCDEQGKVIGVVGISRDITEQKKIEKLIGRYAEEVKRAKENAEKNSKNLARTIKELKLANEKLKQTQSQLLQQEKMASIGQLAAGVAHEINNPTGFVSSNLGTMGEYVEDLMKVFEKYDKLYDFCKKLEDERIASLLREIEDAKESIDLDFILEDFNKVIEESKEGMQRIKKIVQNLKDFSHPGEEKLTYVDVNKAIESTLSIVWNELKYKAEVIKEYGEIPEIKGYPQQLNQVFMNMLINAAQAIKEKGRIRIKTYAEDKNIFIEISDTGVGMSEEVMSHIFEPFFTTKEVGRGTGLGLSMSYGIIKKHNGEIKVKSKIGEGTTFTVKLPLGDEDTQI